MAYDNALPPRYSPARSIDLCSNSFVDVMIPIAVGNFPALLISAGVVPVVWLAARRSPTNSEWGFIVAEGKSISPAVQVRTNRTRRETVVTAGPIEVLRAVMAGPMAVRVSALDLRPLGLNVSGNSDGLMIATNNFKGNVFEGTRVGMALG